MVNIKEIEENLAATLNEGQKENFFEILDFFQNPSLDQAFVLKGYAGTGKTYLIKKVVEWINLTQGRRNNVAITAPTNKAVSVLYNLGEFEQKEYEKAGKDLFDGPKKSYSLTYQTIHKLLGLTETITAKGEQKFTAKRNDENEILNYNFLIVDEVSMLDDSLAVEILRFAKDIKILFSGDPAQIPPINRTDCIPFRNDHHYRFRRGELTEIMRQKAGNPIIENSFILRNNLEKVQPISVLKTEVTDTGNGLIYLHSTLDRDKMRPLLNQYFNTDEFRKDANYAKVLAWRNTTVDYMNTVIRTLLYGDSAPRFVIGEKLIANSPIFVGNGILFNTSEEFEIKEIAEKSERFFEKSYALSAEIYQMTVEAYDPREKITIKKIIKVFKEESLPEYQALISRAKENALNGGMKAKEMWVSYYNIMKWSADIKYNYAITAHKAQGSTYSNVFLIEEDIDRNRKTVERNRIKYTCYSRPTEKLFVLRHNYE